MAKQAVAGSHSKSHLDDNPRLKYCLEHSSDLHPLQKQLMKKLVEVSTKNAYISLEPNKYYAHHKDTLNHRLNVMLGSEDVMIMCSNLLKLIGAKKVLDLGTFTGNSALAWAFALPENGKVITMDVSNKAYLQYGKKYVDQSGVQNKIDFQVRSALETLDELIANGESGTFDFAFIDADKENYQKYYQKCLTLLRPGGVLAVDNALWDNLVYSDGAKDETTEIIDGLNTIVKNDTRVNCSLLPIGDGLMLAFKNLKSQM